MDRLLPMSFDQSRADELAGGRSGSNTLIGAGEVRSSQHSVATGAVINSDSNTGSSRVSTQPPLGSDLSERTTLPNSSSSCPDSDYQAFKRLAQQQRRLEKAFCPSFVGPDSVPSSPPMDNSSEDPGMGLTQLDSEDAEKENARSRGGLKRGIPSSPLRVSSQKQQTPVSRQVSTLSPERKRRQVLFQRPKLPQMTSSTLAGEELALDMDGKVYGIKLEDATFPMGYRPSLYDDPTFFVVQNPSSVASHASEVIAATFDSEPDKENYDSYVLNLDKFGLTSMPEQVSDFRDLVVCNKEGEIVPPSLQIYASNNALRSISPKLFDIPGLKVLTLRGNKIARVPSAIGRAKSLHSVNIANNKIKFLPHTILSLDNLDVIRVRPNKLIEAKDMKAGVLTKVRGKRDVTTNLSEPTKKLRYVGKLRWITANKQVSGTAVTAIKLSRNLSTLQERNFFKEESSFWSQRTKEQTNRVLEEEQRYTAKRTSWAPKLTELSLRKISEYKISRSEILKWKKTTHERVYKMAIKALIHGANDETCGYCGNTVVESVAELMEWWDFKDSKLIPIKRKFCSKRCAELWMKKIDDETEEITPEEEEETRKLKEKEEATAAAAAAAAEEAEWAF